METKQDGDGDPTDEELYVSDISAELEPIIELVGNWMTLEETESEQGHLNDLHEIQKKLQKQDQLIHLLAKASSSLLHVYYNTRDRGSGNSPETEHLREEIQQLTYRNSSLLEQLRMVELQLAETEHRLDDLVTDNRRLSVTLSSSDVSTQERLKDLQKENSHLNSLTSELILQLSSHERRSTGEQHKTKKKALVLQELLESKEAEMTKAEKSKLALRNNVRGLKGRLLAIENETEQLRDELERSRITSANYRALLEKSESENAECREMLREAKQRLSDYDERAARTRLIRHVPNRSSPYYADPDSLACELDRVSRDRLRCLLIQWFDHNTSEYGGSTTWPDDSGSIPCDDVSLCALDCDTVDGNADVYLPMNFQPPMGQPGQPGTSDLDMALDRLRFLQHWKRMISRRTRPALTYAPHNSTPPRIPRSLQFDCELSLLTDSFANGHLRPSASSFQPMKLSFGNSFEGLNGISGGLRSGVIVRGFEKANLSDLNLEEEDDDDIIRGRSRRTGLAHSMLDAWNDSGWSEPQSNHSFRSKAVGSRVDIVPTSESNRTGHRSTGGFACSAMQATHQGAVIQRANLSVMASETTTRNGAGRLPDCVVS